MTRTLLLLTSLALLFAGCADKAEDPGAVQTTPSTTSGAPGAAGTPGANGTGTKGFSPVDIRHDYSGLEETQTFEIPARAGSLKLDVFFTSAVGAGEQVVCPMQANELKIIVISPDGTVVSDQTFGSGSAVSTSSGGRCGPQDSKVAEFAPGTWNVSFEGSGTSLIGVVTVNKNT